MNCAESVESVWQARARMLYLFVECVSSVCERFQTGGDSEKNEWGEAKVWRWKEEKARN